jgi:hypothetical protein
MNLASSMLHQLGLSRRNRPHEARQLTCHRGTDLVEVHAARTQSVETATEAQLRFPGNVANWAAAGSTRGTEG